MTSPGPPPEGWATWGEYSRGKHRCGAMIAMSATGRRCHKDALDDTDPPRCATHYMSDDVKRAWFENHMHRFYRDKLRPELAAAIAEQLDQVPLVERLDLSDELELVRQAAAESVGEYSRVTGIPEATADMKILAGAIMAEELHKVAKMVESMAKVEEVKIRVAGSFAAAVQAVITAVVRAAAEVFQDDYKVREFEARIRECLEARPSGALGIDGTVLTPDMDVSTMDSMVPES